METLPYAQINGRMSGSGYFGKRRYYDLLSTINLVTGIWRDVPGVTNVLGVTGTMTITNAVSGNGTTFYKVEVMLR
jgi:hypothetical protein